ncbi:MAG TPA: hypothetical protein VLS90_15345, partial [Thermodesulfobacteriota bacterium]|nr:hypothetical protein [Thermodesulfobacteriota bacterium]
MIAGKRKPRSIQSRLGLLLLFILLPVVGFQAYTLFENFHSRRDSAIQSNMEMARAVARTFESFVHDIVHQETVIGLSLTSAQRMTSGETARLLETHRDHPGLREFSWVSPRGDVVYSSNPVVVGQNLGERNYFREIVNGREWS